jgi:biotin carboxylase
MLNAYVLVEACNSGKQLADVFKKIIEERDPEAVLINVESIDYTNPYVKFIPPERHKYAKTLCLHEDGGLDRIIQELSRYNIKAVVAGQEPGVELADILSEHFSLKTSNGTQKSEARRNKYEMIRTIAEAGVSAPLFFKSNDFSTILNWATTQASFPEKRVVLKALRSAGSDGVYVCSTQDELVAAFNELINHTTVMGEENSTVLVESFLTGSEYVVNAVSRGGEHYVIDIWKYEKFFLEGHGFIYDKERLVSPSSTEAQQLITYNAHVLNALNIANGPSHAEIMLDPEEGPKLVEVAARISGVVNPGLNDQCLNKLHNHVDLTALCYANPEIFKAVVSASPSKPRQEAMVVNLINENLEGNVEVNQDVLAEIQALPSVFEVMVRVKTGDYLSPTRDLTNSPMRLFMRADTVEQLNSDYETLQILKRGLFTLKPRENAVLVSTFFAQGEKNPSYGLPPTSGLR